MKSKVLAVYDNVMGNTGGFATSLELLNVLIKSNRFDVTVLNTNLISKNDFKPLQLNYKYLTAPFYLLEKPGADFHYLNPKWLIKRLICTVSKICCRFTSYDELFNDYHKVILFGCSRKFLRFFNHQNRKYQIIFNMPGDIVTYTDYWDIFNDRDILINDFKKVDKFLFQSCSQLNRFVEYTKVSKQIASCIPPTVSECVLEPYKNNKKIENSSSIKLVCIGTICKRKNQLLCCEIVAELLARNINCELLLIGNDKTEPEYSNLIKKFVNVHGLDQIVHMLGHKSNYIKFLSESDIVLCTSFSEGISRILRESLFLQKTMVVSNIPGNNDVVIDNYNGYVSNKFDKCAFADKVIDAIYDSTKTELMRKNCQLLYNKIYSPHKYNKNVLQFFA